MGVDALRQRRGAQAAERGQWRGGSGAEPEQWRVGSGAGRGQWRGGPPAGHSVTPVTAPHVADAERIAGDYDGRTPDSTGHIALVGQVRSLGTP